MAISRARVASRQIANSVFVAFCILFTALALAALAAILWSLASQGIGGVNLAVLTSDTPAAGSTGGGLRNAIVGSILMGVEAMFVAIFIGVLAGTWLAEYAGRSRYGSIIRFLNDVLWSAPFASDPALLVPRRVTTVPAWSGFVVGGGRVVMGVGNGRDTPYQLAIYELSDGRRRSWEEGTDLVDLGVLFISTNTVIYRHPAADFGSRLVRFDPGVVPYDP